MVQIIEENRRPDPIRKPTMMDRFKNAFATAMDVGSSTWLREHERKLQEEKEQRVKSAVSQLTGLDVNNLTPEMLGDIVKAFSQQQFKPQSPRKSSDIDYKEAVNSVTAKLLNGEELTPEEKKLVPPNVQLQHQRLNQPPKPTKTALTGQAVPPEVSQAINQIMDRFPKANADQLKMMMDEIGIPPAYSNGYIENRRRQDERASASSDKRVEAGQKRAEKVLDRADKLGEELPILESSIMAMEDSIINGDQSFWSLDNLAEMTGLELFRTAKGGQFKTAAKTYFINDLKSSGARPNMFIEKQLSDALAKVGRSQEANQTVIESFKFSNDLKRKWLETTRELEKFYEESLGYLPGSFNSRIQEVMEPYAKERQKQYENRLKELHVQEKKKSSKKGNKAPESGRFIDVVSPEGDIYEILEHEAGDLPEGWRLQ